MASKELTKEKIYETILVMAIGFLVIFLLSKWNWLLILDILIVFFSLISFSIANFIANKWMLFAEKFGEFNNKIILSLIFFLFLTPISFFYRLFNKKEQFQNTAWKKRQNQFTESNFEEVW
tara:strand:- start:363 stop:725 length:363 start_codon:yes stop_codon:yes gene_type:complete